MGAVSFSLDQNLVKELKNILPLVNFVETGTFKGDTLEKLHNDFDQLYSIELSKEYFEGALRRFSKISNIKIFQGDSSLILSNISDSLRNESTLYFLDAHWCVAAKTAGETSQCPLIGELKSIGKLQSESIIIIDDARLFLCSPLAPHEISQWPTFDEVIKGLYQLSSIHEIAVVNDVILFYPEQAKNAVQAYSQNSGFDWYRAAQSISNEWLEIAEKKEQVIQELVAQIEKKDSLLASQNKTIQAYVETYGHNPIRSIFARVITKVMRLFRPKLGNLNQHAPKEITLEKQRLTVNSGNSCVISIVTPSFNQGDFIERTLLSVIEQKYPNAQYYVQDGGSTDNTVEILEKYQTFLTGWSSEKDSGQSNAINKGMSKTAGEIMCWLNSDDLLLPNSLNTVSEFFANNPEIDVVYGNRLLIDEKDMMIGRWILPAHDENIISWADYIPQETLFWRRRIWEKAGGRIDESFRFAMDWDLIVRFRDVGARFAHIDQFLGAFRIHANQKTSAVINEIGFLEMGRIRERTLGRAPSQMEIRRAIFPYLIKHIAADLFFRLKKRLGLIV